MNFSVAASRIQTSGSAVYATEVSREESLAYTTEETEKVEVMRLANSLGGDIEQAISRLAHDQKSITRKQSKCRTYLYTINHNPDSDEQDKKPDISHAQRGIMQ